MYTRPTSVSSRARTPEEALRTRLLIVTLLLGIAGAAYLLIGFAAFADDSAMGDLRARWVKQLYVASGIDPYEVSPARSAVTAALGAPEPGSTYPPWSFALGMLLAPPLSWDVARAWFGLLNVAALLYLFAWTREQASDLPRHAQLFLVSVVAAISATAVSLRLGQYSLITVALILLMSEALRRGRGVVAGVAFAIAMVKPQMAGLFLLYLLARRGWSAAVVAGVLLFAAIMVPWILTGTDPIRFTREIVTGTSVLADVEHLGILAPLHAFGVPAIVITVAGIAAGLAATGFLLYRYTPTAANDAVLLAIPAIIGLLCTYHRRYDFVLGAFLLVPLGRLALVRGSRTVWGMFALVGASFWAPLTESFWSGAIAVMQQLVWLAGLAFLLSRSPGVPARR